jgi:hypothetical protein
MNIKLIIISIILFIFCVSARYPMADEPNLNFFSSCVTLNRKVIHYQDNLNIINEKKEYFTNNRED